MKRFVCLTFVAVALSAVSCFAFEKQEFCQEEFSDLYTGAIRLYGCKDPSDLNAAVSDLEKNGFLYDGETEKFVKSKLSPDVVMAHFYTKQQMDTLMSVTPDYEKFSGNKFDYDSTAKYISSFSKNLTEKTTVI